MTSNDRVVPNLTLLENIMINYTTTTRKCQVFATHIGVPVLGPSLKERLEVIHCRQRLADTVVEPLGVLVHIMRRPEGVNALLFEYAGG